MKINSLNKKSYEASVEFYSNESKIRPIEKELIKKYFKGKILDLGCGVGRTTKYLFDLGYDVVGVEIIAEMVYRAKEKYPEIKFVVGDACNLEFKDESFNVVFFSYNGLDYISPEIERIKALKEIVRILKPGGYFIYSSHNTLALPFNFRPKFFLRNLIKKTLFSRYKYDKEVFGLLLTYYASPKKQINLMENNTLLRFVETRRMGLKDMYPHYAFRKHIV